MTNEEFCRLDTQFYGEETSHIKQIALRTFNGEELKEYVEHCIKLNSVVLADVSISGCDPYCTYSRAMNQPRPRLCVKCKKPETN